MATNRSRKPKGKIPPPSILAVTLAGAVYKDEVSGRFSILGTFDRCHCAPA
jgi:hypothetical protein